MAAIEAVPLTATQIQQASMALAEAFQDDPLQTYVLPDPQERARLSPARFAAAIWCGHLFGQVFTTSGAPMGAAVCLPPGGHDMTLERLQRMREAGVLKLMTSMGPAAVKRLNEVLKFLEFFHKRDVLSAHWYVMVVGVSPAQQGQGIGRALLQPVLDRAAVEGLPCYLETAQPTNIPFYQRLGFRVLVEAVEPTSGLRLWTLRRDAR